MRKAVWGGILLLVFAINVNAQTPPTAVATDKLGFTQAVSATDYPLITWKLYVDGVAVGTLPNVTCTSATSGSYTCQTANWPTSATGTHRIELTAVYTSGTLVLEGPKSSPFDFAFVKPAAAPTNLIIIR